MAAMKRRKKKATMHEARFVWPRRGLDLCGSCMVSWWSELNIHSIFRSYNMKN